MRTKIYTLKQSMVAYSTIAGTLYLNKCFTLFRLATGGISLTPPQRVELSHNWRPISEQLKGPLMHLKAKIKSPLRRRDSKLTADNRSSRYKKLLFYLCLFLFNDK